MAMNRRDFVKSGSRGLMAGAGLLTGCTFSSHSENTLVDANLLTVDNGEMQIRKGWNSSLLVKTGDSINARGDKFGDCSDFTHFASTADGRDFLWVNHEYINQHVRYGRKIKTRDKTKAMVDLERLDVGGSYLELSRNSTGQYKVFTESVDAFRITAETPMLMTGAAGRGRTVEGMVGNCCGGFTPWGSILSCEENTDDFYSTDKDVFGWTKFYPRATTDYGWVVEIDPLTKTARKHTALGRFAHEGATVVTAQDNRIVVYMADDKEGEHLYKFISANKLKANKKENLDLLTEGTLFVANLKKGTWEELSPRNPSLSKKLDPLSGKSWSLSSILENPRVAAKIVGASKLARPEGITIRKNGDILVSLTQYLTNDDLFGSVVLLQENDNDFCSLTFTTSTWLQAGPEKGFACPDNICTDGNDQVWVTTDISAKLLGAGPFEFAKRNILFKAIESHGKAVDIEVFAVAPQGAEFTGPSFHPNGKELFLSVQHPGEGSFEHKRGLTSHWPNRVGEKPESGVVLLEMM